MHHTVEDQPKIPANYPAAPISQQFDMHDFFRRCVKFAYSLVNLTHHPASSRERRIIADLCGFFFFFFSNHTVLLTAPHSVMSWLVFLLGKQQQQQLTVSL